MGTTRSWRPWSTSVGTLMVGRTCLTSISALSAIIASRFDGVDDSRSNFVSHRMYASSPTWDWTKYGMVRVSGVPHAPAHIAQNRS